MYTLGFVLSALISVAALGSAIGKLTGAPPVMENLHHVGLSVTQIRQLAIPLIIGAVGGLIGLFNTPGLGVAATAGLTLYFLAAVRAHMRIGDQVQEFAPPLALAVVAGAATLVRASTI